MSRTGATISTSDRIISGAGVLYFNFKSFQDRGIKVGATRGGVQTNFNNALRTVEADGLQGDTKGLVLKDKGNPEISVTLLEMTKANFKKCIAGAVETGDILTDGQIKVSDYIDNVTWVGLRNDGETLIQVELFNCLVSENSVAFADNDEGALQVTFESHYSSGFMFEDADGYMQQPCRITVGVPFQDLLSDVGVATVVGAYCKFLLVESLNKIVGIPKNADHFLVIDLTDDSYIEVPHGLGITNLFYSAEIADNGKIYCVPYNYPNGVLVVNPADFTMADIAIPSLTSGSFLSIAKGADGKLYLAPFNDTRVGIIDPANDTIDLTSVIGIIGTQKYTGIVSDGVRKLYCIPRDSTNVLIIDTETTTAESTSITGLTGSNKYYGGVLASNGKIYCVPNVAENVLIIDTLTNAFDITTMSGISNTGVPSSLKYKAGALADNGKIYCVPISAGEILIIDPIANKVYRDVLLEDISETNFVSKYTDVINAGNGYLYVVNSNYLTHGRFRKIGG